MKTIKEKNKRNMFLIKTWFILTILSILGFWNYIFWRIFNSIMKFTFIILKGRTLVLPFFISFKKNIKKFIFFRFSYFVT